MSDDNIGGRRTSRPFRWGIFGTGSISAKFAAGLRSGRGSEVGFVASRAPARARAFASQIGAHHGFAGYTEAIERGGVDAVYIATPPSEHASQALMCLGAGVPVLIEKPFALSAIEAHEIASAAKSANVFAMEGLWTRFLPAARLLRQRVLDGAVGEPRLVTGSFGTSQSLDAGGSMFDPSLGGGAVSHLAPYPISLGHWLFGQPETVRATGSIGPTGVDETVAIELRYPTGVVGSFAVSIRAWASDDFQVSGTSGSTRFRGSIVRPHGVELTEQAPVPADRASFDIRAKLRQHPAVHAVAQRLDRSTRAGWTAEHARYEGNGYHYEADEVQLRILGGHLESPVMPLADSIAVVETMDKVRADLGTT